MGGSVLPVWLIAVGDELLSGRTTDTNSQAIQRALGAYAQRVRRVWVVPDEAEAIAEALAGTEPGGLVFLTGGLGSTPDDLTRESVAAWADVALQEDSAVRTDLEDRCHQRGVSCGEWVDRQVRVPVGMTPLANRVGTAPGLAGRLRGRTLVILPGVPSELRGLLPAALAWLAEAGILQSPRRSLLYRTAQVAETALVERCRPVQTSFPGLGWSWWLVRWGVDIQVVVPPERDEPALVGALADAMRDRLGVQVYATDQRELTTVVQELMIARQVTVSVAESCTGGLLGARLTEQPGASAIFRGGVLAYADEVKRDQLGVSAEILANEGAVSRATAQAMATGCRTRHGTDYAVAITGIAGPEGGSEAKPVGSTWIAVATPGVTHVRLYRFPGSRQHTRQLAVAAALDTLRRLVVTGDETPPWLSEDSWGRTP